MCSTEFRKFTGTETDVEKKERVLGERGNGGGRKAQSKGFSWFL